MGIINDQIHLFGRVQFLELGKLRTHNYGFKHVLKLFLLFVSGNDNMLHNAYLCYIVYMLP